MANKYASSYKNSGSGLSIATIQNISTSSSIIDFNYIAKVDASSGNIIVTLPSCINKSGMKLEITKIDTSNNVVIINPYSGQTINGSANPIYLYGKNDSVSIISDNVNAYIISDSRNSTGSSINYLCCNLSASQTTNLTNGNHIMFDTATSQQGSAITLDTSSAYTTTTGSNSIGRITLQPNRSYKITCNMPVVDTTTAGSYGTFSIYNSDTNTIIGKSSGWQISGGAVNALNPNIITTFSPTVATKIEVRIGVNSGSIVSLGDANIGTPTLLIEEISRQATVINTVDYLNAYANTVQTVSAANTVIQIDTKISGNIPFNASNYQSTLTAGITYKLSADMQYMTCDADFAFYNVTTSEWISDLRAYGSKADYSIIYTPTVNSQIDLRVKYVQTSGVTGYIDANRILMPSITITQIGSTAVSGIPISAVTKAYAHFNRPYDGTQFVSNFSTNLVVYPLNLAQQVVINDITFSDTNDSLTINTTGVYKITFTEYGFSGAGNFAHEAMILINGNTVSKGTSSNIVNMRTSTTVEYVNTISSGSVITFKVQGVASTSDIMGGSVTIQQIN